jgi:HEAT repeat protein
MTFDEITDFIDILRLAPKSEAADEDDIVTLLWEKNIRNMGYTAVEDTVDDDLAVEEGLAIEGDRGESSETPAISSSAEGTARASASDLAPEPVTEDEILGVQNELMGVDEKFLLSSTARLLLDLLSREHDAEAFHPFVQNLGKIMEIRMQKNDLSGAMEIMNGLERISASYDSPKQREMISAVMARAGSPENLRTLFRVAQNPEDIRQYLMLLGRPMISTMIRTLGELQDRRQRKLLCEILAELGRQDIDALADGLSDERWYLIRNLAMILGMTKQPGAVRHIEKVLAHPDMRVRREAVRALDVIRTEDTKMLFLSVLGDVDQTVRMTALKALRRFRDTSLFQLLKGTVSAEELKNKSFAEKREILETLSALGGKEAFPLLSELFRKKGFMEKEDATEIRAAAAYGLGIIGSPEAFSLLEKEAGTRKDILREACAEALKVMRQDGDIRK